MWRDNTRGDYWVLDVAAGADSRHALEPSKRSAAAPDSGLMFAKFSPDSSRVAYVRANNIYVERIDDGKITPAHGGRIRDDDQRNV